MKILMLCPQLPYPPHQGTTLRNFHIIKGLAERHEITLLCYAGNDEEFGPLADLCVEIATIPEPERSMGKRFWQMVSTRKPDMAHRLASFSFDVMLHELLTETAFDVVQIEGIELARVIPIVRETRPDAKIVFDNHNAETALQRSAMKTDWATPSRWVAAAYSWVQVGRLGRFERWAVEESDALTVVSERDALELASFGKRGVVVPNSINTAVYEESSETAPFDVVYVGKMDYRPNVDAVTWFVEEIWPLVRREWPSATFAVVGQKPKAQVQALAGRDGVVVMGRVPSVLPYLFGAKVNVLPLRMGSGTRLKLLEALAVGKPVVSTSVGAEGFALRDGEEVLVRDSAESFARAVIDCLNFPEKYTEMTEQGKKMAENYDYRRIVTRFEALYEKLLA